MTVASGTSRAYRQRELLAARRRKTEARVSRERTRNSRLALAGFIFLGMLMTLGIRTSWAPPMKTTLQVSTDAASQRFAQSHLGRLFLSSLDEAICREMQFNNDTGRLSDDRTVRCDEADGHEERADTPAVDSGNRALSIRNGFTGR